MILDHSMLLFSGKQIYIKICGNKGTQRLIISMGGLHQSLQIMLHHRLLPETVIDLPFTFKFVAH